MKERIDITVPEEVLARNDEKKERLEKTHRLEPTDRVPVVVDAQLWGMLEGRGGHFSDMLEGPRQHLRGQILNHKWRVENVPDDRPIETESITIESDFGALRGVEFPIEIIWNDDQPAKSRHLIQKPEEIDDLKIPPPDGGLNRRRVEWYEAMSEMVDDFDVRLNGEPLEINVDLTHPGGPFPSAFALCGSSLFLWLTTDPERVHRLMDITTRSHLRVIDYFDDITGREHGHPIWVGADASELMGPEMYREFVVPYYLRLWEEHAYPRTFHNCGDISHILDIIRDDLDVTFLNGFGFPADRDLMAEELAGEMVLRGGPHPVLINEGPESEIIDTCMAYIRTVGSRGGYILSEGFGLMPGTPPEHLRAMVEASKRAGPPL